MAQKKVTQSFRNLSAELNCAEGIKGNPIPKSVKNFFLNLKDSNPDLVIHYAGERKMGFFREKHEKLCFLSQHGKSFFFAENPPERSQHFFAYIQNGNEILIYAKF